MKATKTKSAIASRNREVLIARTIRFAARLREQISADVEHCHRSFEAHVVALLRRHYGDNVDIAPAPDTIIGLAQASLMEVPEVHQRLLLRRLR